MIDIYIFELNGNDKYYKLEYKSNSMPRCGEILYFPHHGRYRVYDVIYNITDDCEENRLLWVEISVVKC